MGNVTRAVDGGDDGGGKFDGPAIGGPGDCAGDFEASFFVRLDSAKLLSMNVRSLGPSQSRFCL